MSDNDTLYWSRRGYDNGYEVGQRDARKEVQQSLGINEDWLMNLIADLKDKVEG